jgi:hypothetical protein
MEEERDCDHSPAHALYPIVSLCEPIEPR